jgi:hypothetical protein
MDFVKNHLLIKHGFKKTPPSAFRKCVHPLLTRMPDEPCRLIGDLFKLKLS